jgi:hypothetical protein
MSDADIEFGSKVGIEVWNHLRQTTYVQELLKEMIAVWFSNFANKDGLSLLADVNISREALVQEIILFAQPVAADMLASGFLAERVKAQLSDFYSLDIVAQLFD